MPKLTGMVFWSVLRDPKATARAPKHTAASRSRKQKMKAVCPSCHQDIPVDDVDLATGLGRCRGCNEIFEIPELVAHIQRVKGEGGIATAGASKPPPRPADSLIKLVRKDDKLLVYVPPRGRRSWGVSGLLFSLFWLGFIAFWTAGALGFFFMNGQGQGPKTENIIFALFSVPFWLVGLGMFGGSLAAMFGRRIVYLDSSWMETRWQCFFVRLRKQISREDVQIARPAGPPTFQSNSEHANPTFYAVEIVYKKGKVRIPCETKDEQDWLLAEINDFLETVPCRPEYLGDASPRELWEELSQRR